MAARILGIEFSSDRTAIVEVSYGRQLRIFNFAVIESGAVEPERRIEQLQHTLKLRGFEARDAVVAVSGAGIEHRLISLPQMSDSQLSFVMQREARKISEATEFASSWELIRIDDHLGIKKSQFLLVTAEQSTIAKARDWFARTPLRVQRMTSVAEAIFNLCRCTGLDRRDTPQTIAHIAGGRLHLIFVQSGSMLLSRDVQFEFGGVNAEQLVERLITEIKRSMLLFRQNFPQGQVSQVLFSGEGDFLGILASRSKDELGIDTSVIRYEEQLDRSSFRGEWDEFRFHIPALSAAIGAAWRKTPGSGINLLPGRAGETTRKASLALVSRLAAALVLPATLAVGVHYYLSVSKLGLERAALDARNEAVQPILNRAEEVERRRQTAANVEALLSGTTDDPQWTEIFRSLTFIVPQSAVLEAIRLEGATPQQTIVVQGSLLAPTAQQANADFNTFFNSLRGLGHFSEVALKRPLTVVNESTTGTPEAAPSFQSRVGFEVQCRLAAKT